jgi:transposase, IS5 family
MRPKERRDSGQADLFRARLDQIIDLKHPLVKLAHQVAWPTLETHFGAVYNDGPGQPPLPTRLMAGLAILKHTFNLSDEQLCERWLENPYFQYFCGEEVFCHQLPFERSSMTRWRQRMGEERLMALLQESLAVATRTGAAKPADFRQVIVDTTVQEKAIAFPTDAKLLHRARERLVRLAKAHGVKLRQSYVRVGKRTLIKHQRYAHAKQFARQQGAAAPPHAARACDPRHSAQDQGPCGAGAGFRPSAVIGPARQGPAPGRTGPEGVFAARAGGGVHREGQGAQAL